MSDVYDLDLAATWTGYVRGRFALDIWYVLLSVIPEIMLKFELTTRKLGHGYISALFIIGTIYRVLAFGGLIFFNGSA